MKKKLCQATSPGTGRLYLCLLFVFFISLHSFGQTVTGTVSDVSGKGLPNISVTLKGLTKGTSTNATGGYSIAAASNAVLVFSSVGFVSQEVQVNGRSTVNVTLAADSKEIDAVIVTALGIRKDSRKVGYAATNVKTEDLVTNRTTNVGESLEGRVAGLNITPPAAGAGASNQIRLRGQVGFSGADNSPLLVINGLPLDQGARFADGGGQQRDRGDNLANINPDDIETITVLKGAAAAALYGSRAARGAIVITTKSGQKNQGIGVDFSSSYTTSQALNFMDEIVQTEYGQGQGGQRFTTTGQIEANGQFGWGARLDGQPTINFDGEMRPYSAHPFQLFDYLQTGTNLTNTLGLSGGGPNGSFRTSISTTDSKGIVPGNKYKRTIFNVGINHNVTKKLKLQLNVNFADEDYINPPQIGTQGDGPVNFFNRMPISTPIEAYRDHAANAVGAEWKTSGFLGTVNNPYYPLQNGQRYKEDRNRLLGTATLRYDIFSWLYAQGRFNYDRSDNFAEWNALNGTGSAVLTNSDGTYRGNYNLNQAISTDINADFMVGGSHEFKKFSVDASFGGNTLRSEFKNPNQSVSNFTVANLYSVPNGTIKTQGYGYSRSRINSLYGLAEFGYNKLFYVNFNPLLQPFTVTEKEIGLELRLFNNRLMLDIAAFDKVTTDQILDVVLSSASGYSNSKQNQASLKNSGLETLIENKVLQGKKVKWTTSWNNAFLKTKVLNVGTASGTRLLLYFNGTGNEFLGEIRYTEGLAMNQLYTRTYRRNAKGEIVVGANGRLLESQGGPVGTGFMPVGSSIPKFTGGWNNTVSYKNFSLGVHIDYKFGGTVLTSTLLNMTRQGHSKLSLQGREGGLIFPAVYESNGLPNTTAINVAGNGLQTFYTDYRNLQIGDPFTFKSDFVKLRNISLSYNFTELMKKKSQLKFVKGLSLSASCRNLAILYKDLPGLDPEAIQSSGDVRSGYENSALPTARSYNLTLNVKF